MVKRYSLPDLVFGNGPTQSIMILLKGSSNAGIGCHPALGMNFCCSLLSYDLDLISWSSSTKDEGK